MKYIIILIITLVITSCKSDYQNTPKSEGIKVLIIDGFSNHDWRATTAALLNILKKDDPIPLVILSVIFIVLLTAYVILLDIELN